MVMVVKAEMETSDEEILHRIEIGDCVLVKIGSPGCPPCNDFDLEGKPKLQQKYPYWSMFSVQQNSQISKKWLRLHQHDRYIPKFLLFSNGEGSYLQTEKVLEEEILPECNMKKVKINGLSTVLNDKIGLQLKDDENGLKFVKVIETPKIKQENFQESPKEIFVRGPDGKPVIKQVPGKFGVIKGLKGRSDLNGKIAMQLEKDLKAEKVLLHVSYIKRVEPENIYEDENKDSATSSAPPKSSTADHDTPKTTESSEKHIISVKRENLDNFKCTKTLCRKMEDNEAFEKEDKTTLVGLKSKPELNGREVKVKEVPGGESERYEVEVLPHEPERARL